jgi:hypothetical protein
VALLICLTLVVVSQAYLWFRFLLLLGERPSLFSFHMVSPVTILSVSDLDFYCPDWRSWSDVPTLFLRRRPLTTLGRPTPTVTADLQWGEPRSEAFGTDAHVAGSNVNVAGPAAPCGQPLVLAVSEAVNHDLSCRGRGTRGRAGV